MQISHISAIDGDRSDANRLENAKDIRISNCSEHDVKNRFVQNLRHLLVHHEGRLANKVYYTFNWRRN